MGIFPTLDNDPKTSVILKGALKGLGFSHAVRAAQLVILTDLATQTPIFGASISPDHVIIPVRI